MSKKKNLKKTKFKSQKQNKNYFLPIKKSINPIKKKK